MRGENSGCSRDDTPYSIVDDLGGVDLNHVKPMAASDPSGISMGFAGGSPATMSVTFRLIEPSAAGFPPPDCPAPRPGYTNTRPGPGRRGYPASRRGPGKSDRTSRPFARQPSHRRHRQLGGKRAAPL